MQRQNKIAVGARQQAGHHFDNRHFCSERRIHRAEFQPDVAAADDQQRFWNVFEGERTGRIHQPRAVNLKTGHDRGPRSGGDDDAVKGQRFFAGGSGLRDLERGRVHERSLPLNERDFALFRKLAKSTGQLCDDAFLPTAQLGEIDFWRSVFDAPCLGLLGLIEALEREQADLAAKLGDPVFYKREPAAFLSVKARLDELGTGPALRMGAR